MVEYKRECDGCTLCCQYLGGEVHGKKYGNGTPCHYLTPGKGCNIYEDRIKGYCDTYFCAWIKDENIPYWMKPNQVDAILDWRVNDDGVKFLRVTEAKKTLKAKVLHWVIQYCWKNGYNLKYQYKGQNYYIGDKKFLSKKRD